MKPSLHVHNMELTRPRRDGEPLMHSHNAASEDKDNRYEFSHPDTQTSWNRPKPLKERFVGWRRSLLLGSVVSVVVLFFNLGFTLWAVQHRHVQDGQGVLFEGDCKKVQNAGIGFHLIINILSTALLSASNYAMVCWRRFSLLQTYAHCNAASFECTNEEGYRHSPPKRTMARHWCVERPEFVSSIQETVLAVDMFSLSSAPLHLMSAPRFIPFPKCSASLD